MKVLMDYIRDNSRDDATFFKAVQMKRDGSNEQDVILFVIKQLQQERDLSKRVLDKVLESRKVIQMRN